MQRYYFIVRCNLSLCRGMSRATEVVTQVELSLWFLRVLALRHTSELGTVESAPSKDRRRSGGGKPGIRGTGPANAPVLLRSLG